MTGLEFALSMIRSRPDMQVTERMIKAIRCYDAIALTASGSTKHARRYLAMLIKIPEARKLLGIYDAVLSGIVANEEAELAEANYQALIGE